MPRRPVRTIIVEPHYLIRAMLSMLLSDHFFHVVGAFAQIDTIEDLQSIVGDVELVILSGYGVEHALEEAGVIGSAHPHSKIVYLFDQMSSAEMREVCTSTIDGCVSLRVSHNLVMRTLEVVVNDDVRMFVLDERAVHHARQEFAEDEAADMSNGHGRSDGFDQTKMIPSSHRSELSGREREILDGLVKGLSNKEIARQFEIAEPTVKAHLKTIMRKIRVSNRTQAAIWANDRKLGWISAQPRSLQMAPTSAGTYPL